MFINNWWEGLKKREPDSSQWCPMGTNWDMAYSVWTQETSFTAQVFKHQRRLLSLGDFQHAAKHSPEQSLLSHHAWVVWGWTRWSSVVLAKRSYRHSVELRGPITPPWAIGNDLPKAHCWPLLLQGDNAVSCSTSFPKGAPGPFITTILVRGTYPRRRNSYFPLLNFMRLTSAHFSNVLRFLWMGTIWSMKKKLSVSNSHFVSPANLMRARSVPSARLLTKVLNNIGLSIDPWDTSVVTGLWVDTDFESLSSSVHLVFNPPHCWPTQSVFYPFVNEDGMGDGVKGLAEFTIKNIHCSPPSHWGSHLTVGSYQLGKA